VVFEPELDGGDPALAYFLGSAGGAEMIVFCWYNSGTPYGRFESIFCLWAWQENHDTWSP